MLFDMASRQQQEHDDLNAHANMLAQQQHHDKEVRSDKDPQQQVSKVCDSSWWPTSIGDRNICEGSKT
jgi:hypothetical protein